MYSCHLVKGQMIVCMRCAYSLSRVWFFATPRTVPCQVPLSMGILQAKILEWIGMPISRGSSQPRDWTRSPVLQVDSLPSEPSGNPKITVEGSLSLLKVIFLTKKSNQSLMHCRRILYQLSNKGSPTEGLLCVCIGFFLGSQFFSNGLYVYFMPISYCFN